MKKLKILIAICVFVFILLQVSNAYIYPGPQISGCVPDLKLSAIGSVEIEQGKQKIFYATVYDVKCGVRHVYLDIDGIQKDWISITPLYYDSIIPEKPKDFQIDLKIPENISIGAYEGTYWVKTNEKWFKMHKLSVIVNEPVEKNVSEKAEKIPENISEMFEEHILEGQKEMTQSTIYALIIAAVGIIFALFLYVRKE